MIRVRSEDYKCLDETCQKRFRDYPGPTRCPKCKGIHIEWISFKAYHDRKKYGWNAEEKK